MHILNIDVKNIYAVGDIHGHFDILVGMIKNYDIKDSAVICCGDCGVGFSGPEVDKGLMGKLNRTCSRNNVRVIMVRGNHDNPRFFDEGLVNTKYITAVPDYSLIRAPFIECGEILCVGGATSIDRTRRLDEKEAVVKRYLKYHPDCTIEEAKQATPNSYWEDEAPVYKEDEFKAIKDEGFVINHVITHTCPSFCEPLSKDGIEYWLATDPGLDEVINSERVVMDQIYSKLLEDGHDIKSWTYGHYHKHWSQVIDGVRFTMLDCDRNGKIDWIEIRN